MEKIEFKNFEEYLLDNERIILNEFTKDINENIVASRDLTPEEEKKIDEALDEFMKRYNELKEQNLSFEEIESTMLKEGTLGMILGGLAGFALGKTIGKTVAKVLGVQQGFFYDLLTSRLFGAAMGAVMGKRI